MHLVWLNWITELVELPCILRVLAVRGMSQLHSSLGQAAECGCGLERDHGSWEVLLVLLHTGIRIKRRMHLSAVVEGAESLIWERVESRRDVRRVRVGAIAWNVLERLSDADLEPSSRPV